jgi:transcriptional regulator with XRE-family HTH domain
VTTTYSPARLRQLVEADGRGQRAIARSAGTYPGNLRDWMHGRTVPTADSLARLLTALGKAWADLDAR